MSINSIQHHSTLSLREIRQDLKENCKIRDDLSRDLRKVNNSVTELKTLATVINKELAKDQSLLKSLQSVSKKHGENATVRLKNDHFKFGQASNFFKKMVSSSRYQAEREAAVKKINAEGSTISAGKAITTLQAKVDEGLYRADKTKTWMAEENQKVQSFKNEIKKFESNIDELSKMERKAGEAEAKTRAARETFSIVYQSNAGCKALNSVARHVFGNSPPVNTKCGSNVVDEYRKAHGYEIFSHGAKELKHTIEAHCSDLSKLVKTGAEAWYTPTGKNITSFRGQGMTQSGVDKLITRFNADKSYNTESVYNLGQFFSTSTKQTVAAAFANSSQDDVRVLFKVNGNSSNGLSIPGGLQFQNDEGERLYSPLANFKVTNIQKQSSNVYHIALEEVGKVKRAPLLPY